MNSKAIRECMTQAVIAVMQSVVIIAGALTTATLMKTRGYPDPTRHWHAWALFVRNWGFLLLLIPAIWAVGTIWLERNPRYNFSTRGTVLTGLLVFVGLGVLMVVSVFLGSAAGSLIQSVEAVKTN